MSTITATNLHGDTIRKTGGSLGVDIRVKNNSVYESDGGTSVTQNLVQGLCKQWSHHSGAAVVADSFNQSSLTDNGSGDNTHPFVNNMANANYSVTFGGGQGTTGSSFPVFCINDGLGTSSFRYDVGYTDGGGEYNYEWPDCTHQVVGDLA
tara:strand:- start:15149 stop:15601 length:453 start_codon:yes stop_codon:yes gene_type:complete